MDVNEKLKQVMQEKYLQLLQEFYEEHADEFVQKLLDADYTYAAQTMYTQDQLLELLQKYRKQDRMAFANYIKNTFVDYVFVMDELLSGSDRVMYYKDALKAVDRALKETTL